jgi:hypothetical protein
MTYRSLAGLSLLALVLAGCQGAVTADLATDPPADPQVSNVTVDVQGLEFERSDGTSKKLEFTTAQRLELIELDVNGDALRLFTDEALSEGSYTGVRLLLADDETGSVSRSDGTQYPLQIAEGDYARVNFTVEKDKASRENLALSLDLRRSLSFNTDDGEYTLTPQLRAAPAGTAARINGSVEQACPSGTSLDTGGAVYLFEGHDVEPDDIGSGIEPYATTAVMSSLFDSQFTYALRFLPPGDYTIALTCNGNDDDPTANDDLTFVLAANVTLDDSEVLEQNLP